MDEVRGVKRKSPDDEPAELFKRHLTMQPGIPSPTPRSPDVGTTRSVTRIASEPVTIAERYAAERQRFVAIGRQLYELESLLGHDRAQVGPGRCQRCDKIQPPSGASSASSASLLPASTSHPPSDAPAPADAKILPSLAEFASPRTLCCNVCEWILAHLSLKRQEFVHSYREVQRFQQALEPTSGSLSPPLRSISAPLQHSTFSSTGTGRSPFVISSSSPELPHSPSSPHQSSSGGMIHSRLFPPKGPLLNSRLFTNY